MKRRNRIYIFLCILCFLLFSFADELSFSQTDTANIQLSEEESSQSDFYYKSRYSYLDINLKEDRSLIKFGFFPFIPGAGYEFGTIFLQASYESKIGKQFSITREINSSYIIADKSFYNSHQVNSIHSSRTGFGLTCRYYPGMKKRIANGNGADNLNGGYFSLNAINLVSFVTNRWNEYPYGSRKYSTLEFSPQLLLAIGYQKRISRLIYFDTQVFGGRWLNTHIIRPHQTFLGVKLLMGIAFNPNDI
jgi:hypothetical protein